MQNQNKKQSGFVLIEALLAVGIATVMIGVIGSGLVLGASRAKDAGMRFRAEWLTKEGIAAVQAIRDEDFASLSDGVWGVSATSGMWALSGTSNTIDDFTREITISSIDAETKSVTSTTSWVSSRGGTSTSSRTTYFTNWHAETTPLATDWSTPTVAAIFDLPTSADGTGIVASGNYVYIIRSTGLNRLDVVDVSSVAAPKLVGTLSLTGKPNDIAIFGNTVYIASANNTSELQIIDVTTPSTPTLVKGYDITGSINAKSVAVSGSTVFLGRVKNVNEELFAIDVTSPTSPSVLGKMNISNDVNDITISGSYAYLATSDSSAEIQAINVATPSAMSLTGSYNVAGSGTQMLALSKTTVFTAVGKVMTMIDVTTPTMITLLGSSTYAGNINAITVSSDGPSAVFVTLAQKTPGIVISNASSPALVTTVASVNMSSIPNALAASSTALYAVTSSNSEELITVTAL